MLRRFTNGDTSFRKLRTLSEVNVAGKSVLLRADLDVLPLAHGNLDNRLTSVKESVNHLCDRGAKRIVILGHIGRPKEKDARLSTKLLISSLRSILDKNIAFAQDFDRVPEGKIVVFENVRFWPEETEKSESSARAAFAKSLACMGDVYVNDAFGTCHRNNASMVDVPTLLPSVAGLHVEREIAVFEQVFKRPKKGFVAIIGGVKIETKLPLINKLAIIAEYVLVGGILPKEIQRDRLQFPNNVIVANLKSDLSDIDKDSADNFVRIIKRAKTIVWNGPMGVFEKKESSTGTDAVAYTIATTTKTNCAFSVAGGGETEKYLRRKKLLADFTHVSNGGGASLEFLSGNRLLALEQLRS
mgnify:CR=1 FL=1